MASHPEVIASLLILRQADHHLLTRLLHVLVHQVGVAVARAQREVEAVLQDKIHEESSDVVLVYFILSWK